MNQAKAIAVECLSVGLGIAELGGLRLRTTSGADAAAGNLLPPTAAGPAEPTICS